LKKDLNNSGLNIIAIKKWLSIFLMLVMCFVVSGSMSFSNEMSERAAKKGKVRTFGKGELKVIEGIPFLKLSGSYYEMGEQYGTLLKEEFQKVYNELIPFKSRWLPELPDSILEKLEKITPVSIIQQLKGMSAGSGLPYQDLLLGAYFGVLERGGCSSILIRLKEKKSETRLLHGRNFDYGKGLGKYPVVIEYQPEKGLKYLTIGTIASASLAEGMNEKGITVSENLGRGDRKDNDIHNPPADHKLKEILSSASFLKEADKMMKGFTSDVGNILTVGSGFENDAIIYDVYYDNLKKNQFNGQSWLFATSGYLNKDLNPPKDCPRYQIIDKHMKSGKINGVDGLIDVLSDPGSPYGVNNPSTIHSVVFDPQNKIVYMAFHTKFAAWSQWLKLDWEKDAVTVYRNAQVDKLENTDSVELTEVHIIGAYWQRDPRIPRGPILKNLHFFISVREWLKEQNAQQLYDFSALAAREITLKAEGHPDIEAVITKGTIAMSNIRGYWFTINEEDLNKMVPDTPYTIHIDNISAIYRWIVEDGVTLTRPEDK